MTIEQVLSEEFKLLGEELIQKHDQLKMRASGRWAESIEDVIENPKDGLYIAQVWGEHYTEQLVDGRAPGEFPPVKAIEKWIYDKGIQALEDNIKISSLAFLIARKIAREGTEYFKEGGTDLVEAVFTPARIQKIIDRVTEINIDFVVNSAVDELRKFAVV